MQRRYIIVAAAVVVGAAGWYAFRPERLFVNKTVSELPPVATASAAGAVEQAGGAVLAAGDFHGVHHDTKGHAAILQQPGGKRILRLTDFATSNGPDVRVYLIAANDAADNGTVTSAGFVEVAPLKGNIGDQNYQLPEGVDLAKYRAVSIWCKRFAVNFGTAPLMPGGDLTSAPAAATRAAMPSAPILEMGRFHRGAHETAGLATVYDLGGKRVLRLTEFTTSNGPDVHVYLVAAPDVNDDATVKRAEFIDLGSMKGNRGDQNYDIPAGVDLAKYRTATIWCKRFSVNFGSAALTAS